MVCAQASHARAWNLRRFRAGAGTGTCDWARRMLCGRVLLWERDASLVERNVYESAGRRDYRHTAEQAAGADAVVRVSVGTGEFLLPDVSLEPAKLRDHNIYL